MKKPLNRIPILALLLVVAIPASRAVAQVGTSAWVYPSAAGDLLYQLDERGQRITDFSQCGYRSGTEPLPNVNVVIPQNLWVYVSDDGPADDTIRIQAVIDSVKARTPDANGWRGVVYLNAGEYQLATTLKMNSAGGVVLKGAGDDPATGTRLRATGTVQYDLISANGSGSRTTVNGTTRNLVQKLVPAGTRTFEVDSTSGLAVGHTVIVKRPSTTEWIADIDMDQLAVVPVDPNDPPVDPANPLNAGPWAAGSKDLFFDRTITHIEGNWITVDAPLPQTFESKYGGGQIWRYTWAGRMQQVGIEDIYAFCDFVGSPSTSSTDENHAWNFIYMSRTENGWIRNITAQYFALSAVWLGTDGKNITVADSLCLDPISLVTGGRRYPFQTTDGELSLFVNNYARRARHDFSFGAVTPGPNVFVHGMADSSTSDTGPHQRWSVGGLFDLITINGNEINVRNRGNSGSGHGWAAAYMAVWNCKADGFRVRNPPTARNWLVGSIGPIGSSSGFSVGADPAGTYDSSGPTGTGKNVYPRSLYYGQLQQRTKLQDCQFREVWLGDVDQHSSTGGTGETVNCDPAWLTQVEALGALPADAKFDYLVGNRHTAFTMDFQLDPGDTIVAASLTVSLRAITDASADNLWLDSTAGPQSFTSLGWTPVSTTVPTVRTLAVTPSLLNDGRLNVALGTNSAVDFATLHLQVQKAQPSTSTLTLNPVADAYVQGGANANTNYGLTPFTSLVTKEDTNPDLDREIFLRWDLSGVSGKIIHARVRLAGTSAAQIGNETCAALVSDDAWQEATITFATKPASGQLFAQWLPVTGQPAEFTVTPQVAEALLDNDLLSLRVFSTANYGANGNVSYASRENSTVANRPQLILTIENPPVAAVKAATGSALNVGPAWTNGLVPVLPDTATWNATSLTGTLTLGADLRWAGLIVSTLTGPLTFNGTQTLSLGSAGIDMSAAAADLTLNHPVFLEENQTWSVGASRTLTANGQISGPRNLTKTGAGSLILSGAKTYTDTIIDRGTLTFSATSPSLGGGLLFGAAPSNTTAGTLDLTPVNATFGDSLAVNTNSVTASEIKIGPAQTLTVNNTVQIGATTPTVTSTSNLTMTGGGTFNVAMADVGTFVVGGANGTTARQDATLSLTALKATTIDTSTTGILRVGPSTNNANGKGMLLLPAPSVADTLATTTLTAATLAVGNGSSGGGTVSNLTLGTGLTKLNADTINVGTGGRDVGQIIYGQAAGDLILRAADGTSRATVLNIASLNGATANTQTSSVDVSGHDADILVTTLNVGNQPRSNNMSTAFNFGQGDNSLASKLDVTNVNISLRPQTTSTTTATHTARVNLSGGTVTFGNAAATGTGVDIGNSAYFGNGTSSGSTVGELNISAGNVTIHNSASLSAAVRLGTNAATGNATVTASLNLTGGTTTLGGDIIRNAVSPRTTSTLKVSGGTLDMGGNSIGTATEIITFTTESGTLSNVKSINGTAGLTKTTANTLTIAGTNTYSGATTVSTGTLALSGSLTGALTVNGGTLAPLGMPATAGAFRLNSSSTYQTRINGVTAGTLYDQLTAGGSVTLGGPLNLIAGPGLAAGTSFTVLNKTSAGAISGIFTGKPEGSVFTEDGYTWIISYLGGDGNDATLTLATALQAWRYTYFSTIANSGTAADTFDANGDGELNLLEFATGQNPTTPSLVTLSAARTASAVEVTYTRSNAALDGGMIFSVEWSDTLAPGSWSTAGVTQTPLTDNGTLQSIKATVPAGPTFPVRFARLKVTSP